MQTTRTDSTKILPARQANSETLIFWQVFGPRDWFSRLCLELECLKMASVGEKLGSEAESAESAVRHQICCLARQWMCCLARLSSPGRRGRWPPAEIRGQQ